MDDLNEIFERATDADLDTELAAAGELLQKIAQQEGVDLSELSDEDVAELMVDLLPKTAADEGEHKSAREEYEYRKRETKMASEITFADVAVELSKVAANEGIDLDGLSRGQYHELFDIVAESMQDPDYMENKLAQDEANAKLAEADALGRYMARAFMDEQQKIARAPKEVLDRIAAGEELRTKRGVPPVPDKPMGAHARELTAKAKQKLLAGVERVGGEVGNVVNRVSNRPLVHGGKKYLNPRNVGAASLIAGTAAAAGGAKMLHDRFSEGKNKKSLDEQALEMARDYLLENGIDPDTGHKLASDDDVAQRAAEILAEAGWL
jgi:hypothetical protein